MQDVAHWYNCRFIAGINRAYESVISSFEAIAASFLSYNIRYQNTESTLAWFSIKPDAGTRLIKPEGSQYSFQCYQIASFGYSIIKFRPISFGYLIMFEIIFPSVPTFSIFFTLIKEHLEQAAHILTAIVEKAGHGDELARAALYKQFSQQMFSICVRMTGNYDDAKDLLHDSFINAYNSLHQLRESHLFGPWLRRIVVNECIRYTKKQFTWQCLDEEAKADDHENVDWLKELDFSKIQQEIRNLPGGCREIFNLYVLEDFTHHEIADTLNISVSTSKSQYHRARQLLKERLLKRMVNHG